MKTDITDNEASKVGSNDLLAERNQKANELLKSSIREREQEAGRARGWITIDFIEEERFLHEIKGDTEIKDSMSAEEVAEYVEEQIYS